MTLIEVNDYARQKPSGEMIKTAGCRQRHGAAMVHKLQNGLGRNGTNTRKGNVKLLCQLLDRCGLPGVRGKTQLVDIATLKNSMLHKVGIQFVQAGGNGKAFVVQRCPATAGVKDVTKILQQPVGNIDGRMGDTRQGGTEQAGRFGVFQKATGLPQQAWIKW